MREIFIGSSSRGLKHAEALRKHVDSGLQSRGTDLRCDLWNDDHMFQLSWVTIDSLVRIATHLKDINGYALILFTPDDIVRMNVGKIQQEKEQFAARDNVVFELGLFMGILGRANTFCIRPSNVDMRILSDWNGVITANYRHFWRPNKTIAVEMKRPANLIVEHILLNSTKTEDAELNTNVINEMVEVEKTKQYDEFSTDRGQMNAIRDKANQLAEQTGRERRSDYAGRIHSIS